jgi:uncharacterized protein YciI
MSEPNHLLLYDYVEDIVERRAPYRAEHLARIRSEREAGRVGLAGALGDPPVGAAFAFQGVPREHVEAFARDDPYVKAGLVKSHRIEVWNLV